MGEIGALIAVLVGMQKGASALVLLSYHVTPQPHSFVC